MYRRAKDLIKNGLVTMVGHTKVSDGRRVNEYGTTFSRAKFDVQKRDCMSVPNYKTSF